MGALSVNVPFNLQALSNVLLSTDFLDRPYQQRFQILNSLNLSIRDDV